MKNIEVNLSVAGVNKAIRELERYQNRLETKTADLVDELVDGGAEMAKYAFGTMATVDKVSEGGTGIIEAVGENDKSLCRHDRPLPTPLRACTSARGPS